MQGTFSIWSPDSGRPLDRADMKGLEIKAGKQAAAPQQLQLKLMLTVNNGDFQFHSGPLASGVIDGGHFPTLAAFNKASVEQVGEFGQGIITADN